MIVPRGVTLYANGKRYKAGSEAPKHLFSGKEGLDEEKIKAKGERFAEAQSQAKAQPKPKAVKKSEKPAAAEAAPEKGKA